MKNKLFYLVAITTFCCLNSFGQKSFILNNDNQKIIVNDNFYDIELIGEMIEYKVPNNDEVQTIKFKNINSAVLGEYKMNRMKIADEKEDQLCFSLAESKGKKLIGYNKIISTANTGINLDKGGGRMIKFIYYILDENGKVIEKIETYSSSDEKFTKLRKAAEDKIIKHFSDCKEVMDRLVAGQLKKQNNVKYSKMESKMLDRMDAKKANIELFFETPTHSNCDEIKPGNSTIQKEANVSISIPDQKYYFEKISSTVMGNGTKTTDFSMKGTINFKDNSFVFYAKDVETTYKIISYKDGVMKCEDNGNIHTVTITTEVGKKGSFAYDTKITFVSDTKMGGSTTYYWCKKQ